MPSSKNSFQPLDTMFSFILITRKPFFFAALPVGSSKTSNKPIKFLLPSPRRVIRYLLILLAFWAFLTFSRFILPSSLPCQRSLLPAVTGTRERRGLSELEGTTSFVRSAAGPIMQPCLDFSETYRNVSATRRKRKYMMAVVSGGLNQQRNQIIDAVVIARILGAVLVAPVLQVNQVWEDDSEFGDIFDEKHFKETLKDDVKVLSALPSSHLKRRKVRGPLMPFHADEDWIRTHYLPKVRRNVVFLLRAFDSRLSHNISADLQKLRCKVAFEALRFQPWIEGTADKLVGRMREKGPYMALHLRMEKDVWVRTGCLPGLGEEDDSEIRREREMHPTMLTSRSKLTPQQRYLAGYCPLNALEISRILKGLGVTKSTRIYWAGGRPLGGDKALEPLRTQFSNLYNKWDLVRAGELNDFQDKPSLLAALDYIVSLKSHVFMANHGGNMARALQGHRTYMNYGENIKPNKKLLVNLLMNKSLTEGEIQKKIQEMHRNSYDNDRMLLEKNKPKIDVIASPTRYCMCNKRRFPI